MSENIPKKTNSNKTYKKLNISRSKLEDITVTPEVSDKKLLFDRNNRKHRYMVQDDNED